MRIRFSGRHTDLPVIKKVQDSTFDRPWAVCAAAPFSGSRVPLKAAQFSIKGGFVGSGAQRRMVIVGKIGRF